jgi:hypothetical protein
MILVSYLYAAMIRGNLHIFLYDQDGTLQDVQDWGIRDRQAREAIRHACRVYGLTRTRKRISWEMTEGQWLLAARTDFDGNLMLPSDELDARIFADIQRTPDHSKPGHAAWL